MVKVASAGGFSPAAIAVARWSSLGVLLFLALRIPAFRAMTRAKWPSRADAARAMLVGFGLFGPSHLIYYLALTRTSTIEGTVLGTTAPVWTALMAFLILRERVVGRRALAIAVGFAGAWIVSVGFAVPELRAGNTAGNLLYLTGVLTESTASIFSASIIRRASGITVLAFQILGAMVALALAPFLLGGVLPFHVSGVTPAGIGALAYLVLAPGLVCFSVWYMLVERTPLSLMVLSILLQPPLSAFFGWALLREPLTAQLGAGTGLILVALLLGATEQRSSLRLAAVHREKMATDEHGEGDRGRDAHHAGGHPVLRLDERAEEAD
jgi:drug/metabolite transporter (DMT)-like permease